MKRLPVVLALAALRTPRRPRVQTGATLVEFVVIVPTLLFMLLNLIQYGLLYHARSQLNYATFEAARAGTVAHADPAAIRTAFTRAMTGYYGGGTTTAQLAASYAKAAADTAAARIEILSPATESFDDYASPALAARLGRATRVIPNAGIAFLRCPPDRPGCNSDPASNQSGQTLADANLLKLRVTYGIPEAKQIPLAGRFMTWALGVLDPADADAFRRALVANGRIPVVVHTVMRMQSPAFENGNASAPGPGNDGKPEDPGPPPEGDPLPPCPATDPACTPGSGPGPGDPEPEAPVPPICDPAIDAACPPPDPCDPPPYTPVPIQGG